MSGWDSRGVLSSGRAIPFRWSPEFRPTYHVSCTVQDRSRWPTCRSVWPRDPPFCTPRTERPGERVAGCDPGGQFDHGHEEYGHHGPYHVKWRGMAGSGRHGSDHHRCGRECDRYGRHRDRESLHHEECRHDRHGCRWVSPVLSRSSHRGVAPGELQYRGDAPSRSDRCLWRGRGDGGGVGGSHLQTHPDTS